MKKRMMAFVLAVTCMFSGMVTAQAAGNEVYSIDSAADLIQLAEDINSGKTYAKVELNADITLNRDVIAADGTLNSGTFQEWIPIGTEKNPFTSTFDGRGHTISGLYVKNNNTCQGLFGVLSNAIVYNVTVQDSYIDANSHVGAVAGYAKKDTIISNCYSLHNYLYTTVTRTGGIVGWTDQSDVYNCTNSSYCYSKRCSGGIVGDVYSNGGIYNCMNSGKIEGGELVGGMSGGTTSAVITNCLNIGEVSGYLMAGGAGSRTLTNCYSVKNDTLNSNCSMGTSSKTAVTFTEPAAVLSSAVTVDGTSYTNAVDALNAWVHAQTDGIAYVSWQQDDSYPYLEKTVLPAVRSMTENTFTDVSLRDWFYNPVKKAYDENLMMGTSTTTFEPKIVVTRGMVAQMLYNKSGRPNYTQGIAFSDVKSSAWYYDAVQWASENGYAAGYGNGKFGPQDEVTREQFAQFLYSYYYDGNTPASYTGPMSKFTDAERVSGWAKNAVAWAVSNGIINGRTQSNGSLEIAPKGTTTRAEAAAMLSSYTQLAAR